VDASIKLALQFIEIGEHVIIIMPAFLRKGDLKRCLVDSADGDLIVIPEHDPFE
jgi:hypothetical protein